MTAVGTLEPDDVALVKKSWRDAPWRAVIETPADETVTATVSLTEIRISV
jgi:hypothetical protein